MVLVSSKPMVLVGLIAVVTHFLQAGRECETLLCMEEPMTTLEFITALFCQVDDHLPGIPKHPEAHLTGPEVGLGVFGQGAHLLIDLVEQCCDKIHRGHTALLSGERCHAY